MSDKGEDDLIALVEREQRGFRRILFGGMATLIVLVAMSAALGVYYFDVSRKLRDTTLALQYEAFQMRRRIDQQTNRLAGQEAALRRAYDEMRSGFAGPGGALSGQQLLSALEAARHYLQRGRLSLADERLIGSAALGAAAGATPQQKALLRGAAGLIAWTRSGQTIQRGGDLPAPLVDVLAAFEESAGDPQLAPLAHTGIAWVRFLNASSDRSNYRPADCETVLAGAAQSATGGAPGPQPLYWQAQCERKMGRTRDSLRDYARALEDSAAAAEARAADDAELTLAMNAFHGVGTTLIAAHDLAEGDIEFALGVARSRCQDAPEAGAAGSERMRLALACLDEAMRLRRRLGQTPNQVSGSGENLSFAHLRDGNFAAAFDNAVRVEQTGLFAWNELVRALTAEHLKSENPAARRALPAARRNVSFFTVGQFNICELQVLLAPALFEEAMRIVAEEHPGEEAVCAPAGS